MTIILRLILTPLIMIIVLIDGSFAVAEKKVSLTTFYPSPVGVYDRLTLVPQTNLPANCAIGMLMVDQTSGDLNYCHDDGTGHGVWGGLEGVWAISGYNIYPLSSITNTNLAIGIGTATPSFKIHLENDGGILAIGQFGSGATLPAYDPVARNYHNFMWYPGKAAFRAGGSGTWSDVDIGNYSIGFGLNPMASGATSTITGGDSNIAAGTSSTVVGGNANNITNTALFATAIGGANNTLSGQYAAVSGLNNIASGNHSVIAGGNCNFAGGTASTVLGGSDNNSQQDNTGASRCIAEANIGSYSTISGGSLNRSLGDYSSIIGGSASRATGTYSTIAGRGDTNLVSGNYSTLIGGGTDRSTISHNYSVGLGNNIGSDSSSWPYQTIIGRGTYAGQSGVIIGIGNPAGQTFGAYANVTTGYMNFASGQYNWVGGSRQLTEGHRSFVWGDDPGTARTTTTSNAFIINTGKVGVHQANPTYYLDIIDDGSTNYFAVTSNGGAGNSGDIFVVKSNGYIGIGNRNPNYPLQIGNLTNSSGNPVGILTTAGVWTEPSSRDYKSHIKPLSLSDAQKAFSELKPVTYHYKDYPLEPHTGFIAEDTPLPIATPQKDSVDNMGLIAVLTKVVQNHKAEIKNTRQVLDELDTKLQILEKELSHP